MRRKDNLVHKLFTPVSYGAKSGESGARKRQGQHLYSCDGSARRDRFLRLFRYVCFASLRETPSRKYAVAARPIAYVPAPATIPQTTLPHPGRNFSIARVPSRRSIPTPTFAPSAVMNSVAARRLRSLPLIYIIPETINTCRAVRNGMSANGIGCAPIAAQTAVVDFINICAT